MKTSSINLIRELQGPKADLAWDRFIELYSPLIHYWAKRRGLQPTDSADLVQDVLLTLCQRIGQFDPNGPGRFRGWLRTITVNRVADFYRRQRLLMETHMDGSLEPAIDKASDDFWDEVTFRRYLIAKTLEDIRPKLQPLVWQAGYEQLINGLSARDVSSKLKISMNGAYVAKSRLLHRLRQHLGDLLD